MKHADRAGTIRRAEVAAALEVTDRTLRNWETELGLSQARVPGRIVAYDLPALLRWLLEQGHESSSLQRARARDMEARAEMREMELMRRRGDLLAIDDVLPLVRLSLEAVDRSLKAAPQRHAKAWARQLKVSEPIAVRLGRQLVEDARADLRALAEREYDAPKPSSRG